MTLENNNDGAPKLHASSSSSINNSSGIDAVTEDLNNMAVLDDNDATTLSVCANCGKKGDEDNSLKFCGACKLVKYCSATCQKAHRPMHKKECKKRAAELRDEKLFKEVEPEECPICMLTMPLEDKASLFHACCGKSICSGCIYTMAMNEDKDICPFCRMPEAASDEEAMQRMKKLMDKGNPESILGIGGYYAFGYNGLQQNWAKSNELMLKAGDLGCSKGYYNLAMSYEQGDGVEVDMKKAKEYYEQAAMMGNVEAKYDLGSLEGKSGNYRRSVQYYMVAAKAGKKGALDKVKIGFRNGLVTKDEYESTLRAHQQRLDEMKSDARDSAAVSLANMTMS